METLNASQRVENPRGVDYAVTGDVPTSPSFCVAMTPQAKSVVCSLAEELGFVGVDSGELERAQLVEAVADFIRFQILGMSLGPFATISVHLVPHASEGGTQQTT
jgi:hypothetical protein